MPLTHEGFVGGVLVYNAIYFNHMQNHTTTIRLVQRAGVLLQISSHPCPPPTGAAWTSLTSVRGLGPCLPKLVISWHFRHRPFWKLTDGRSGNMVGILFLFPFLAWQDTVIPDPKRKDFRQDKEARGRVLKVWAFSGKKGNDGGLSKTKRHCLTGCWGPGWETGDRSGQSQGSGGERQVALVLVLVPDPSSALLRLFFSHLHPDLQAQRPGGLQSDLSSPKLDSCTRTLCKTEQQEVSLILGEALAITAFMLWSLQPKS